MSEKLLTYVDDGTVRVIGWMASFAAILMYFSYIDQIILNFNGNKGSSLQALATVINCSLWVVYGMARAKRDWPIIAANLPGIFLGMLAFFSAL